MATLKLIFSIFAEFFSLLKSFKVSRREKWYSEEKETFEKLRKAETDEERKEASLKIADIIKRLK